jgi:hypothetical protein
MKLEYLKEFCKKLINTPNFMSLEFDPSVRSQIFQIYKGLVNEWLSSSLFLNLENYSELAHFIPKNNLRSSNYVRFILSEFKKYATVLFYYNL